MEPQKMIEFYIDLWKAENPIKSNKLMVYLVAQPMLALGITTQQKFGLVCYFFATLGILFSIWWFFCIGRTLYYQKLWKTKIVQLGGEDFFPTEEEKKKCFRVFDIMDSWVVCLGPVMAGALIWLIVLVYMVSKGTN